MKLTNKLSMIMLLATINLSTLAQADEIVIPVITKPAVLQEGTQRELTVAQIAELLPWAKNSKVFLEDLVSSIQGLSSADQADRLVDGITYVVGESAPKNAELLMRYSLNRGLALNKILTDEMASDEVGTIDARLRVLRSSIKMALKYYDNDMETINKKVNSPFISYGRDYYYFLSELNKSIFDASAQYNIQKAALEWLQWDLFRDLNNTNYASQIVKINNTVKVLPKTKLNDKQSLSYIRQMKVVALSLNFSDAPKSNVSPVANLTSEAEKNVQYNSSFKVGDVVVMPDYTTGKVTEVFRDGVIYVNYSGSRYTYKSSELNRPISTIGGVSVSDVVIMPDYTTGRVSEVFFDGTVHVSYAGSRYTYKSSELNRPISTIGGVSVNDAVVMPDHTTGRVSEVFFDGTVYVSYAGSRYTYKSNELKKPISSIGGISVNDVVVMPDRTIGRVSEVFFDGTVYVSYAGSRYAYNANELYVK